jgi:hypothetical protein
VFSKTEYACLHVIDSEHPEYSQEDDRVILQVGAASEIDRIDSTSEFNPIPRKDLFGKEPTHDWCYYYQKAQLARQQRNWEMAAQLGDEAIAAGYSPNDPMEWLVFMQAYAYTINGNYDVALAEVKVDEYTLGQACQVFSSYTDEMALTGFSTKHEQLLKDVCSE